MTDSVAFTATLYRLDSKKKVRVWSVSAIELADHTASLVTEFGLITGKKAHEDIHITTGKNIGRKNETSPISQAEKEAKSLVSKQIRKGYAETIEGAMASSDLKLRPMFAHKFKERGKDMPDELIMQPKLDGIRLLGDNPESGEVSQISKGNILYSVPGISELIDRVVQPDEQLDGEMFVLGVPLRKISSAVKKPNVLTPRLIYCVFDMPKVEGRTDLPTWERLEALSDRVKRFKRDFRHNPMVKRIQVVSNKLINKEDIPKWNDYWVKAGMEGIMLRDPNAPYEYGVKSLGLQKYKNFIDSEFLVLDIIKDRRGLAVFVCCPVNNLDAKFEVVPIGTHEYLRWLATEANKADYVGKLLTVRYQTLLDSGIPQFAKGVNPVGTGVAIRDYE